HTTTARRYRLVRRRREPRALIPARVTNSEHVAGSGTPTTTDLAASKAVGRTGACCRLAFMIRRTHTRPASSVAVQQSPQNEHRKQIEERVGNDAGNDSVRALIQKSQHLAE